MSAEPVDLGYLEALPKCGYTGCEAESTCRLRSAFGVIIAHFCAEHGPAALEWWLGASAAEVKRKEREAQGWTEGDFADEVQRV